LLFVIFSEEDIANSGQNSSIIGQFCENNLIPLERLFCSTNDLVDVGDLENSLWDGDYGLDLFQSLNRAQFTCKASKKRLSFLLT